VNRRAALTTAGAVAALTGARLARARRLSERMIGEDPSVRTDDGVRLHVETAGPPDAPLTVVFSHGFAAAATMFDPQWAALRGHARLVRYDQRGHGASGWPGFRSATVERLGRDLGEIIDRLGGTSRVVVVGHSMGGMAVLALAALRPELFGDRIAGVALLSTRAAPLTAGERSHGATLRVRTAVAAVGAWWAWLATPLVHRLHPFRTPLGRRLLRRRLFAGDPADQVTDSVQATWARTPEAVMSAYLRSLTWYDARAALTPLRTVPVLVLAGDQDAVIPARSAEWLTDRIGGPVRRVLVPGAGHMVNLTHPDAVDSALHDLIARVQAGPGG
jgi:pimeloyl-ACP methyl ester carboxylesterase